MTFSSRTRGWLIWAAVVCLVLVLRVGCLVYERSRPFPQRKVAQKSIDQDQLVIVPKFNMDDYLSSRQLVGKPLWIKFGYSTEYFHISQSGTVESEPQLFLPLEKLVVGEMLERPVEPGNRDKQIWIVFQKEDRRYATSAGLYLAASHRYDMHLDDLFYAEDPHVLYNHWHADDWTRIEKHQLASAMTLTQVVFSLGLGRLVMTEAGGVSLYEFARRPGGEPGKTRIRFQDGRVKEVQVSK